MSFTLVTKSKRLVFPLFLLAFSLTYLISSISLGVPLNNGRLTPSFFPLLLGGISTAFTLMLLFRTVRQERNEEGTDSPQKEAETRNIDKFLPLLVIAATVVYTLLFPIMGYFLSSLLYVFSVVIIFSDLNKLVTKFMLTIAVVFLGYLLFEQVFRVRLPALWG